MSHDPVPHITQPKSEDEGLDLSASWATYRYAVVDVEGNGQQPPDLVELAAVLITGGQVGPAREWLVRPPRPITAMARRFHKISDADVAERPAVAEVAREMEAVLAGRVLVAHNAHVDARVLNHELGLAPEYVVDTLKVARLLAPSQPSYKLGHLVEAFGLADLDGGVPEGMVPHRAGYDALMCARLLRYLASLTPGTPLSLLLDPAGRSDRPPKDQDAQALF